MQSIANNYTPTLMPKTKRRTVWPYIAVLALAALVILGLHNKDNIIDWWKLRNYQAPPQVVTLMNDDDLTSYGRTLFEINHPDILARSSFNMDCPNDGGEKTIVLGCYHDNEAGIYLLSVSDQRLNGVMQVTAAHEMLHAAYSRLSTSMRNQVDGWLMNYYNHDLKDPRLLATIAAYKKSEPNDVVNEMHSVFGTEVMNLPGPLENYYKRYFTNRHQIAEYAAQYEGEFTSRQTEVSNDDAQLASMLTQINDMKSILSSQSDQLANERKQLQSLANSGDVSGYNALVDQYNGQVDSYNSQADNLKNLVDTYNNLVSTRNAIALTENQLYSELSGTPAPVQTK